MNIWYKTISRAYVDNYRYKRGSYPILTERTLAELRVAYYEEDLSAKDLLNMLDHILEKESRR